LITSGHYVYDDRGAWSGHQVSAAEENRFVDEYGYYEYGG
jgi:hypothetical protein